MIFLDPDLINVDPITEMPLSLDNDFPGPDLINVDTVTEMLIPLGNFVFWTPI